MLKQFDAKKFDGLFPAKLAALQGAEKITKTVLAELSREVLAAVHKTEDSSYINRLMVVLTPVNRKVVILFFKAFSGFTFKQEEQMFSKKDKKQYDAKEQAAIEFLDDPHNNIWTWAERAVEVEAKAFDIEKVKKSMAAMIKQAEGAGYDKRAVLKQVFNAGFGEEDVIALLDEVFGLIPEVK